MSVQIEIWAEDSRGPPGPNLNRKKYTKMWRNLMVPRFSQILGLGSGVFREALRHARANLGDFAALKVLAFEKHASANCGPARSGFITLILICRGHSPCQKRELELRRCRYKSVQQRLKSLLTLERLSCQ